MKRKSARRSRSSSRRKSSNGSISLFGIKLTRWIVLSAFLVALPVAILLNSNSSSSVLSALSVATQTPPVPIGSFDSATCNRLDGWTCDPSNFQTPIRVDFYADGPAGTGKRIGSKTASSPRSDLGRVCGGITTHAFSVTTPIGLKDGKEHIIYAYGNSIDAKANIYTLLTHQKKITCARPIPTPTRTPTPSRRPTPTPTRTPTALRVFITSSTYDGNLGGLTGADAKCHIATASHPNLAGSYKAWLSDETGSVVGRFTHSSKPYKLLNGTTIANNWSDLTHLTGKSDYLLAPIDIDENGTRRYSRAVWTNTEEHGYGPNSHKHCNNWTSADSSLQGTVGDNDNFTTSAWTNAGSIPCSNNRKNLYCFEQ